MNDCDVCLLPDPYDGDGDGIGSCDCPRCECGAAYGSVFCSCPLDDDYGCRFCGAEVGHFATCGIYADE